MSKAKSNPDLARIEQLVIQALPVNELVRSFTGNMYIGKTDQGHNAFEIHQEYTSVGLLDRKLIKCNSVNDIKWFVINFLSNGKTDLWIERTNGAYFPMAVTEFENVDVLHAFFEDIERNMGITYIWFYER